MKKSAAYLCLLLVCFLTGPLVQGLLILAIIPLTIYTAKVTPQRYLKWLMIPLPFLAVSLITILMTTSPNAGDLLISLPFFGRFLGISAASLDMGMHLFFRSFSCLVCTYLYILSVPFQQILQVMKRAHFPLLLIELTMLMYRFIFIFLDEVFILKRSQEMRFGFNGLKNSYLSLGMMIKLLFLQTFDRFNKMTLSLEMKFFNGDFPM
ncbi:cobalt ECF transporter T component CbiQ [Enterococcus sp. 669A]|uniref:Cobalt ECF transporter T component CbiQ n=1 Tax=Candidatus Enterococcus moelleringii TaxID=2815325 RepID=A0ABS3LED6_9ENTE|nr:cobalt ECF transporter T component CbiQ [Enterococcus sp. 669A]MBO1307997.1 cobalt ECF transporter T component CbiQ [Enterococcus sp. 669A]